MSEATTEERLPIGTRVQVESESLGDFAATVKGHVPPEESAWNRFFYLVTIDDEEGDVLEALCVTEEEIVSAETPEQQKNSAYLANEYAPEPPEMTPDQGEAIDRTIADYGNVLTRDASEKQDAGTLPR